MFPRDMSISLVPTQNAIVVSTTPEQMALVQKLFTELDRPKTAYRITYTVTDSDGGKRIGVQHFALATSSGARTTLKQGSKVPISTGVYDQGHSGTQTQFTYLDVGLNFDTTVDDLAGGVHLKTKLEQSSIAPETSGVGLSDPIVRQSVLEGTSLVTLGKSLTLGSLDVPGSTRHLEVEVVVDQIK
jgi:type II secretory pathway component GspD/PulD (secretin)